MAKAKRNRGGSRPGATRSSKSKAAAFGVAASRAAHTTRSKFDRAVVEQGVRMILEGIGENRSRPGLVDTPRRVREFYEELLSGMWEDPAQHLVPIETEYDHDLVVVKNIRFTSICEHHLLPFMGTVGVAYVPRGGRLVGISKIVRAVDAVSRRLQIQERMTCEIADVVARELRPAGVFVVVEAEHLCMTVRGVRKPGALIVTTEARGILKEPGRQALVAQSMSR